MRVFLKFFQSLLWTRAQGCSWAWQVPGGGRATLPWGWAAEKGPSCWLSVDPVLQAELSLGSLHRPRGGVTSIPQTELGRGMAAPCQMEKGMLEELVLGSLGPRRSFWLREQLSGLPTKCVLALATAQRS